MSDKNLLYHYTSKEGLLGIVNDKAIWATHIRYLNDGKEFTYASDMIKENIIKLKEVSAPEKIIILKTIETLINDLISYEQSQNVIPFVSSFSKRGNLLSQWRAYCTYGNGFSLGFDFAYLANFSGFNQSSKLVIMLLKCIYNENEQKDIIQKFIDKHSKTLLEDSSTSNYVSIIGDFISLASQLKHPSFIEEEEYRLVIFLPVGLHRIYIKFRPGKTTDIPYINLQVAKKNECVPIKVIRIGPTPDTELTLNSIKSLLLVKNMETCELKVSNIPYREI